MQIFKVDYNSETEVIGAFPQLCFPYEKQDYNPTKDYSISSIKSKQNGLADVRLPLFEKSRWGKLNDFLSYSGPGSGEIYIFSEAMMEILAQIKMPNYQTKPVEIINNTKGNYFCVYFSNNCEILDWENSSFVLMGKQYSIIQDNIQFQDKEDYLRLLRSPERRKNRLDIRERRIELKEPEYDLFRPNSPLNGLYCTQKIIDLVNQYKLIGLNFPPVKKHYEYPNYSS